MCLRAGPAIGVWANVGWLSSLAVGACGFFLCSEQKEVVKLRVGARTREGGMLVGRSTTAGFLHRLL